MGCTVVVEVVTSAGAIALPDVERLKKGTIRTISVRAGDGAKKSSTGKLLAHATVLGTAHLLLKSEGGTEIFPMPLDNLVRTTASPEPLCVNWPPIAPASSQITLDTTAANYNAAHVVEIVFGIDCPNECWPNK